MLPQGLPGNGGYRMKVAPCIEWLMRFVLLSIFLSNFACAHEASSRSPSPATVTVIDATPSFWKFWSASSDKTESERVRLFFDVVVAAHPELFGTGVLNEQGLTDKATSEKAESIVAAYLRNVSPYITRMKSLSETIQRNFGKYARSFTATFPEYAPSTPVYFTVSLFSFDGATRTVAGKTALLFGIDGIARYHGKDANPKVLFDHELFHQYHYQIAPELTVDQAPLWVSLWEEGLATYVSQQMNPGSSEAEVLMSDNLAERSAPMLATLSRELLSNFGSTDSKEYAAFFFGSNGRPDLPPRCGYYVGYQIARKLSAGRSLQQLASLRGPELESSIKVILERFTQQP
jgi:Predicted Zn-dependent protease (DUF2268)